VTSPLAAPPPRHLKSAPITEALVDLRVEPALPDLAALDAFRSETASTFPEIHEQVQIKSVISLAQAVPAERRPTGYMMRSADKTRVVQAQLGGLTVSQLAPYTKWDDLRDLAKSVAGTYFANAGSRSITRWALRFINKIEVPRGAELGQYFRVAPFLQPDFPQALEGAFLRFVIPYEGARVILTQVSGEVSSSSSDRIAVILDIDAFKVGPIPSEGDALWASLEQLREIKNKVFFGCLTEKTVRMFE